MSACSCWACQAMGDPVTKRAVDLILKLIVTGPRRPTGPAKVARDEASKFLAELNYHKDKEMP